MELLNRSPVSHSGNKVGLNNRKHGGVLGDYLIVFTRSVTRGETAPLPTSQMFVSVMFVHQLLHHFPPRELMISSCYLLFIHQTLSVCLSEKDISKQPWQVWHLTAESLVVNWRHVWSGFRVGAGKKSWGGGARQRQGEVGNRMEQPSVLF